MLERITVQIPSVAKESLRKECYENRTSYREIISQMIIDRYGLSSESEKREKQKKKITKASSA